MLTTYAQDKMARIAEFRSKPDATLGEALKATKTSVSAYYHWKKIQEKTPKKPKVKLKKTSKPYMQEIPLQMSPVREPRIVCLIGSPSEIAKIIGELK